MCDIEKIVTIDKGSKITIGLALSVLVVLTGGIYWGGGIPKQIDALIASNTELRHIVEKNTAALIANDRAVGIVQTLLETYNERLRTIEQDRRK